MGDLAKARELVLDGLRIDPYHGALWTVYAIIERQDGSHAKARKVCACVRLCPTVFCGTVLSGMPSWCNSRIRLRSTRVCRLIDLRPCVCVYFCVSSLTRPPAHWLAGFNTWSNRSCSWVSEPAPITAPSTVAGLRWSTSWATRQSPGGSSSRGWRLARPTPVCTTRMRTWRPLW